MNTIITRFFQFPKRLLLAASMLLCFLSLALVPATALAASSTTCAPKDVTCIIQFGDKQIADRITALNNLSTKVTNDHNKRLIDDAHADLLQTDIKTNIDGLNDLKKTLD